MTPRDTPTMLPAQDLTHVPSALLTDSEKQELVAVRRRPLMVLGWLQLTLRDIRRRVDIDTVQANHFEQNLASLSLSYHGCAKLVSQPLPFAYEQLVAVLALLYCLSVPTTTSSRTNTHAPAPTPTHNLNSSPSPRPLP